MTDGERLDEIVEAAVAQGQAPGGGPGLAQGWPWPIVRAAGETGLPAVCHEVLATTGATA